MRRAGVWGALGVAAVAGVAALAYLRYERRRADTVAQTTVEAVRRVAKLATVEMQVSNWQLRRDAKDLLGFIPIKCQKTVAVFYRGTVAAGFDLGPASAVSVNVVHDRNARRVQVRLPPARILSMDVPAPELVVADGSICNWIEPADYTRMHTEARAAIEREAIAAGLLVRAEAHARDLVDAVVRPLGFEAVVTVTGAGGRRSLMPIWMEAGLFASTARAPSAAPATYGQTGSGGGKTHVLLVEHSKLPRQSAAAAHVPPAAIRAIQVMVA